MGQSDIESLLSHARRCCVELRPAAVVTAAAIAVAAAFLVPGGAAGGTRAQTAQSALELSVVDQINELRVSLGLRPLSVSRGLFGSASLHCEQMVNGGYFGHKAPNGSSFAVRLDAFYPQQHHVYYRVGENLLWSGGPVSGAAIVAEWMQSAPHRENLLDPRWRQVAVATLSVPSAPGVYAEAPVTVVTADFGVRR
jgi:uncharacterized protein YkwD